MRRRYLAVALLAVLLPSVPAWAIDADEANDICPADADPCLVNQSYDVVNGSVLDFGTRTVRITAGGQIDTNTGSVTILSGPFLVDAGLVPGIKVNGNNDFGVTDGGTLIVQARRRCSLDPDRTCLGDSQCTFGSCNVSVCSGNPNRTCASDAGCDFGTCSANRCTADANRVCTDDADCQQGTCSLKVCSGNRGTQCSTDGECNFGTCSVGQGNVELLSPIRADGGSLGGVPGTVLIRAAGDVNVASNITANSNSKDSDGGSIDVEADMGTVTIGASLSASGGGQSTGGEVYLAGGQDVVVNQAIDVSGGDFDGGIIEIDTVRDVNLNHELQASSTNGGGFGGEIDITAGRDITVALPGGMEADGHYSSVDNVGGWGGTIGMVAGRNIAVNSGVSIAANGALPDGFGGEIGLDTGADLTLAGTIEARVSMNGSYGVGGNVDISTTGAFFFPIGGLIDVRGAQDGGGAVYVITNGPMTFGGTMDARATSNGTADSINIDIGGDVTMTGAARIAGKPTGLVNGQVTFEFCRLTMQSGAVIENVGAYGKNILRARERVTIQSGASITADASTGVNRIVYRDEAKPPAVNGTVTPAAPADDVNPFLAGCPVCGNNELDGGETCEDGNTVDGDGCNAECQDEGCVAQTPGYPDVAVCDDGNGCTHDVCEAHACSHVDTCDDGIDCTVDSCIVDKNECAHVPNNASCDDGNPCTDDVCVVSNGCVTVNNSEPCDDSISCTGNDICTKGLCSGQDTCPSGQSCNLETNQCEVGGVCGDGIVDGIEECDDGDTSWLAGDACDASCLSVACGDPDNSGTIRASDALFILRAAVNVASCSPCVCNVDSNASGPPITASDALRVLRASVGIVVPLVCPATC